MILYFSAEGNSRAVAEGLGKALGEETVSILSASPSDIEFRGDTLGFVFPIYSWGVPPILLEYAKSLSDGFIREVGERSVWTVCTCGDDVGMAPEMLKRILIARGLNFCGGWSVQMPNTYVALPGFDVDPVEVEKEKLAKSKSRIAEIARKIASGEWTEDYVRGGMAWLKSKVVFPLFVRWGITPSRWHATDACVGCGICAKACPVGNIRMENRSDSHRWPKWGKDCISCMACYHSCPRHAVEYGRITRRKGQYLYSD